MFTTVENKHGRVEYPCYQCEYAASDLKRHAKIKSEGVRNCCCQCEYVAN